MAPEVRRRSLLALRAALQPPGSRAARGACPCSSPCAGPPALPHCRPCLSSPAGDPAKLRRAVRHVERWNHDVPAADRWVGARGLHVMRLRCPCVGCGVLGRAVGLPRPRRLHGRRRDGHAAARCPPTLLALPINRRQIPVLGQRARLHAAAGVEVHPHRQDQLVGARAARGASRCARCACLCCRGGAGGGARLRAGDPCWGGARRTACRTLSHLSSPSPPARPPPRFLPRPATC